jgi:tRNA-specific 2-thiouridylase
MHIDLDLPGRPQDNRVVVAMSGGVDSSVVAAMLKDAGYDVLGVTLQLYDHGAAVHRKGACCAGQDIHDARRVADAIGIPHYVLDYEERFRTAVIDRFAASYASGETPIPCVECNQRIKFTDLLDTARDLGAAALATGHYVASRPLPSGGRALLRGRDPDRDQSYFLYGTTPEQLRLLRFPLGDLSKTETRDLARGYGLHIADKHDSQDICFVPTGHYADIVGRLQPDAGEAGDIVHLDGRVLGRHKGIMHYTIGQRRGLGLSTGEPLFVVGLEASAHRVVVGPREALAIRRIALRGINWLGSEDVAALPAEGLDVFVKVRSTRPPTPALLRRGENGVEILLAEAEEGVAPGQACVFYDAADGQARVLGGGIIASAPQRVAQPEFSEAV